MQINASLSDDSLADRPREFHSRRWLLAILAIAACLYAARLNDRDLWLDELNALEIASGRGAVHLTIPFNQMIAPAPLTTQLGGAPAIQRIFSTIGDYPHPPLYLILLRLVESTFGNSAWIVRLPALLFTLASIALLFDVTCRIASPQVAIGAAAVFSVSTPVVEFASEVRGYSMATCLVLCVADVLVRLVSLPQSRKSRTVLSTLLAVSMFASMFTLYQSAFTLMGMIGWSLIVKRRDRAAMLSVFGASAVAAVGWAIVWGPYFIEQSHHFSGIDPTTDYLKLNNLGTWLIALLALPVRLLTDAPAALSPIAAGASLLLLVVLLVTATRGMSFLWSWLVITVFGVAIVDLQRHITQISYIRYVLLAVPPLCVLISSARWRDRRTTWPLAISIVACVFAMQIPFTQPNKRWSLVGQAIDENVRDPADATVLFVATGQPDWAIGYLYEATTHYTKHLPGSIALVHGEALSEHLDLLQGRSNVWIVSPDQPDTAAATMRPLIDAGYDLQPVDAGDDTPAMLFRVGKKLQ